ncbi:MAG: NUDIX hydrolase [Corynebacteriales bacterium]|nr:NUDIX hydrolase [Mycobacteriales bacterium]
MPRVNDTPDPYNPNHVGYLVNVSNLEPRIFRREDEDFPLAPFRTGIAGEGVARHKNADGADFTGDLGEILATDICVIHDGKILFGVRDDGEEPQLCLIGGKVDDLEGVYEAAPREFVEETGGVIDPDRLKVVTVRVVTADERNTDHATFVTMACRYDLSPGEAETLGLTPTREIKSYHWLPFDPKTGSLHNDTGFSFFAGHDQVASEVLTVDRDRLAEIRTEDAVRMKQHRERVAYSPSALPRRHVTVHLLEGGTQQMPKPRPPKI